MAAKAVALTVLVTALVGCGSEPRKGAGESSERLLTRTPRLGVSCPQPNSIACDRVGLAVWLERPADVVTATVAGQPLRLSLGSRPHGYWVGYLQPAGLLDGPLEVVPDRRGGQYWGGSRESRGRRARVTITIRDRAGIERRATRIVPLHAGWG